MNGWNDFNNAEDQQDYDVIPKGTLAVVRMTIKPGGYDNPQQGWTGGYATQNPDTGAVYLDCEFVVLVGKYAKRKVWSKIGLHSEKGENWANMGRSFIKGVLNSTHGLMPDDNSPQANQKRCISGFQDLEGIEFLAKIGTEKDSHNELRNIIQLAVTPDHKDYKEHMSGNSVGGVAQQQTAAQPAPRQTSSITPAGKPSWAQ